MPARLPGGIHEEGSGPHIGCVGESLPDSVVKTTVGRRAIAAPYVLETNRTVRPCAVIQRQRLAMVRHAHDVGQHQTKTHRLPSLGDKARNILTPSAPIVTPYVLQPGPTRAAIVSAMTRPTPALGSEHRTRPAADRDTGLRLSSVGDHRTAMQRLRRNTDQCRRRSARPRACGC